MINYAFRLLFVILISVCSLASDYFVDRFTGRYQHIAFDTTQANTGSGDVLGPLNIIKELRKRKSIKNKITVFYDDYAYKYLKQEIEEGGLKINFVRKEQAIEEAKDIDLLFSLFTPHRNLDEFNNDLEKAVLMNNGNIYYGGSLHNTDGEIFVGRNSAKKKITTTFNEAGFGQQQSGVLWDSVVSDIAELSSEQRTQWAKAQLKELPIYGEIAKIKSREELFSVVYGVNISKTYDDQYPDKSSQFVEYIRGVAKRSNGSPVTILNPEPQDVIEKAMAKNFGDALPQNIKVKSIDRLTPEQFIAMVVLSDLPVAVEGDNSVSAIVKLKKQFMLFRSDWNQPVADNLKSAIESINPQKAKSFPFIELRGSQYTKLSQDIGYWLDYMISRFVIADKINSDGVYIEEHIDKIKSKLPQEAKSQQYFLHKSLNNFKKETCRSAVSAFSK